MTTRACCSNDSDSSARTHALIKANRPFSTMASTLAGSSGIISTRYVVGPGWQCAVSPHAWDDGWRCFLRMRGLVLIFWPFFAVLGGAGRRRLWLLLIPSVNHPTANAPRSAGKLEPNPWRLRSTNNLGTDRCAVWSVSRGCAPWPAWGWLRWSWFAFL